MQLAGGFGEAQVDRVHCQQFGQTGLLQQLFKIVLLGSQGDSSGSSSSSSAQKAIKAMFEALAQAIKEKDKAAVALINKQSWLLANIQVQQIGQLQHLQGFDYKWLAATIQQLELEKEGQGEGEDSREDRGCQVDVGRADKACSEAVLAVALLAIERVIQQAQKALQAKVVRSAAVYYIEWQEAGSESNKKLFNAGQKGQTIAKYIRAQKAVIAYIQQTRGLEPVEGVVEGAGEGAVAEEEEEEVEEEGEGDRGRDSLGQDSRICD